MLHECLFHMYSQSKKRKLLKWFEDVFIRVSGDDQPIQTEEFAAAIHLDHVR